MSEEQEEYWAIHFEDAEMPPEIFSSESSSKARFAQLEIGWNVHLLGPAERIANAESSLASEREAHEAAKRLVERLSEVVTCAQTGLGLKAVQMINAIIRSRMSDKEQA